MKIIRADEMGFCYGVAKAVDTVETLIKENKKIYILGMLIHNPSYLERLRTKGVVTVKEEDFLNEKVQIPKDATVVLRAHGAKKNLLDKLEKMSLEKVDTTCPYVTKSIMVKQEEEKNGVVVYIGDKNHPEVQAVLSYGKRTLVVKDLEELKASNLDRDKEYSFIVQKTYDYNKFKEIKIYAKKFFKEAIFKDDLCGATYERQEAVCRMAKEVDIVIIIGGYMSSNTQKLYKIAKELNVNSYLVEGCEEVKKEWFKGMKKVGISAGASTPYEVIDEVEDRIKQLTE